jgi:hypothetical protein
MLENGTIVQSEFDVDITITFISFLGKLVLCLRSHIPQLTLWKQPTSNETCLGTLLNNAWECEDEKLDIEKDGEKWIFTGKARHFSRYAILFTGRQILLFVLFLLRSIKWQRKSGGWWKSNCCNCRIRACNSTCDRRDDCRLDLTPFFMIN